MSGSAITRSAKGCLTCKNRKKKCDEARPICTRCINGDFKCLGYDYLAIRKGPRRRKKKVPAGSDQVPCASDLPAGDDSTASLFDLPAHVPQQTVNSHQPSVTPSIELSSMVQPPQVNPFDPDHIIQMFIFYSLQPPTGVQPFQSIPFSLAHAAAERSKSSRIRLKSIYVGARVKKAILDGASLPVGVRLIDDFQRQITSTVLAPDTNVADVTDYLGCLIGLVLTSMAIVNTPTGYMLLRKSVPFFLTVATKFQELWVDDLSISVRHALAHPEAPVTQFVFLDTMIALTLGIVPLIHYDITLNPMVHPSERSHIEWAHGCSAIVITLLARVNSWRAARLIDPTHATPTPEQQREFQACLREWNPTIEYGDQPAIVMGRLAVQETWKHAVLIYMYMGMCETDSADPRVEASVRQVAQLTATIEDNHPLEVHMIIPCIIAAAAARKEKHRAILRKKIVASRNEKVCLVRGADFVLVLDHLWHGAAVGGRPTTWQDYVDSRFAMLPVGL